MTAFLLLALAQVGRRRRLSVLLPRHRRPSRPLNYLHSWAYPDHHGSVPGPYTHPQTASNEPPDYLLSVPQFRKHAWVGWPQLRPSRRHSTHPLMFCLEAVQQENPPRLSPILKNQQNTWL